MFLYSFLYTLMPGVMSVQVMSLNAPGQAVPIQTLDISGPAAAIGFPISAFVICFYFNGIHCCNRVDGTNISGMTTYVRPQA